MDQFESDAHTREVLIGIGTAVLIWIEYRVREWRAFVFVGQGMIGNDYIQALPPGPNKWLVSANAAIDTDDEFVPVSDGLLQRGLLNSITFSETMRDMVTNVTAKQLQRPQKDRCASGPVHVLVAVNQHALARIDCPQ